MTLPEGWVEANLSDLCKKIVDGSHNPPPAVASGRPMLSARNITNGQITFGQVRNIESGAFEIEHRRTQIAGGTVLITIVGALGRSAVVTDELEPFTVQRSVGVLHPEDEIDPHFLARRFDAEDAQRWFHDHARGTAQKGVYLKTLSGFSLDLPPNTEQRRIVAKLDALAARLARARAELDRVPVLASSWRQTKLAEAFALSSAEAGQTTTSALCVSITDGDHQAPPKALTGIPFITISAMNDGRIDLKRATRFVPETYFSGLKEMRRPQKGDVLYSVTGSFGIAALVRSDEPFVFQRHIAILRPAPHRCDPEWLALMLEAPQVRAQAAAVATGTAQMTVPLTRLRAFALPDLKIEQQQQQVSRLSAAFARADRLEAEAVRARSLIDRLESAILARAFRGELVPQDPNDEPASVLLDRIRAERAAAPKAKRGRRAKADA